jgi:hypothetical protein
MEDIYLEAGVDAVIERTGAEFAAELEARPVPPDLTELDHS